MTISNKIRDQKMQYDMNRKAEKISTSSLGKEILQVKKYCLQRRIIEEAKFTYSSLGKALQKNKSNWVSRQKANKSNWR